MSNYRLIALDVDGTLITDDHQITARTKETIRTVCEAGAQIVLCTGRGPLSTLPILAELGLTGTVITHNGAATIHSANRTVMNQFAFRIEEVARIIHYCKQHDIQFDANAAYELYVEQISEEAREMYRKYFADPIEVGDILSLTEPIVKLSICAEGAVLDKLTEDWPHIGNPKLRMIRSGEFFIDVMHPEANKGNALAQLAGELGIAASEVLAIGNYFNDIEMITFAGMGIAMDNSPEGVKASADAMTASNNEEGVSEALIRYCLT